MNFKFILTTSICAISSCLAIAQKASDVQLYVEKYKDLAIAEQKRTGVPAAIKLAQGIHESGCGNSELSINARNHFGIKCKTNWTGQTYTYTDDAKDECFRKYDDDFSSYRDHSDFLKNSKRYATLFDLNVTDYKSWAYGLKKCGYATNPKYAQRIVDLVEKYELNQYSQLNNEGDYGDDDAALESMIAVASTAPIMVTPSEKVEKLDQQNNDSRAYYVVTVKNGLKGFYGKQGDLLLNAAYVNKIRYGKLLELNDLTDEPLQEDMFIYLEKKRKEGRSETYTIQDGENLLSVAQEQGMRLKDLKTYNHLKGAEEPEVGTVLHLKNTAPKKPLLKGPIFGNKANPDYERKESGNGYIAGGAKPVQKTQPVTQNNSYPKAGENETKRETPKVVQQPVVKEVEEEFNIANEEAVEEQIAKERETVTTKTIEPAVQATEPAKEMSDLDRLKAKLDQSVYGNTNANNNSRTQITNTKPQTNNNEVYQTRPASAANINNTNTRIANTPSGGVESLKRRIEAHQNNGSEEPVVANKSNVSNVKPAAANAESPAEPKSAKPTAKKVEKKEVKPKSHTVKKGETATAIAAKYGLSVKELSKLNGLPANGSLKVGQQLKLK